MSNLIFTLIPILGIIIGVQVYAILEYRRKVKAYEAPKEEEKKEEAMLDDISYIKEMQHLSGKIDLLLWQQYDILLAAQKYCWETMVDYVAYLETADFDKIDSLAVADLASEPSVELIHVYNQTKGGLKNFEQLKEEKGTLSIAGHSRALNDSVKIVWFNQTNVLRVFTLINNETLVKKYVETVIRRTFGTPDAMKLAKPVPKQE
jgi:hypothetical protein